MYTESQRLEKWQIPFFGIWTGQAVSLVGSRIAQFALVWWLTQLTGSATVLATASLVALVPEILLGPLAGAYVDRWSRRLVLIVADGVVALAALGLVFLFWRGAIQVWHVYVVMLIRAVGGSFHWTAMQASTSLMVPKKQLARVAGLNQMMNGTLSIIGPVLGALLLSWLPLYGVMLVDVGTAGLAILPLLFVAVPQPHREEMAADAGAKPSVWEDVRGGLRYIQGWPGLMALIGTAVTVKIALTPAFALIPLLVSKHFGGDAAQLSLMESVAGVGLVAGGVLLSVWGGFKRKIYTTMMGIAILGAGFVVLGVTPGDWFWLGLGSMFVIGLMIPLVDGPIMAILQGTVAPDMQGRVFTIVGSLLSMTSPLGLAVAGPVSDWLGLQVWFLAAGVLCLAAALSGFFVPALANIEQNHGEAAGEGMRAPMPLAEAPGAGE